MRNLILHQIHIQNLLQGNVHPIAYWIDEFSKILIIVDSELNILIFSYENSDAYSNFELKKKIELEMVLGSTPEGMEVLSYLMEQISSNTFTDITNSPIKFIIYKNEEETVHLLLSSGYYINFDTITEKVKINYFFDANLNTKILCAEISPNLENIVLVASNFKLMLINYDFEIIINWKDLDDGDGSAVINDGQCKEASISWRGDSAFFCVLYDINGGKKCLVRDNKFTIHKGPARADNKVVFSMAEGPVKNLANLVSWQPSGSLIAYYQEGVISEENTKISAGERSGIIFSEKNCLKHGEFFITGNQISNTENKKISAKLMKWNMDLPLLIIYFDTINLVCIYKRSNYDWTLKYSYYLNEGEKLFSIKFSDAVSLRLYSLYTNGKFCTREFKLEYQNTLTNYNFSDNNGTCAVLNGNNLKLTPLGSVNIPPPLCLETIKLSNTRKCPYILSNWKNYMFVLSDNNIDLLKVSHKTKSYSLVENDFSKLNVTFNTKFVKNFIFTTNEENSLGYFIINRIIEDDDSEDELLILTFEINFDKEDIVFKKYAGSVVHKIKRCVVLFNSVLSERLYDENYFKTREMVDSTNKEAEAKSKEKEKLDEDDLFMNLVGMNSKKTEFTSGLDKELHSSSNSHSSKSFYILNSHKNEKERTFSKVTIENNNLSFEEMNIFTNFDIIKSLSVITYNNEEKIVYLSRNNRLFINNTLLALDVTSFEFFKHFLLFTQSSNTPYNTLHIIDLNKKDYLQIANNSNNISNPTAQEGLFVPDFNYKSFSIRTLERSAQIVSVSKVNLILQMSRGNLETIYPRLLVLNQITELVTINRDYKQAFEVGRKHKINTNFLYDIDPEGFLKNIPSFLTQVEKSDWINLFLNCLDNSLCEEMLQLDSEINSKEDFKKLYINNKVNKICEEMRKELVLINKNNKYLTSILHTHTKKSPPEYLKALKLVQSLKIEEKNNLKLEELASSGDKKGNHHSSADKALEYLCWVVNAEVLFDFSLKTYDFELVIMVAKHTQKDPKEYLPYLKKLQDLSEIDPILMKNQVNMDLKNYDDALYELSLGKDKYFDKCLELINKYELYEQSFSLFEDEKLIQVLYKNYADYLKNNKKNNTEAAWAYLRSQNYEDAVKCFIEGGCVNEIFTIYQMFPKYFDNKIFEILSEVVDVCTSAKKFAEIEKIYLYITENNSKLKGISDTESTFNYNTLLSKTIEGLFRSKRWKSAYLFYNFLIFNKESVQIIKDFREGINLAANLQLNELKKNILFYEEKYNRLLKVQHLKRTQPHLYMIDLGGNLNDNVSDSGSVVSGLSNFSNTKSKKSSMSKTSKSSKLTKKSKAKITKRNVKEGSPLEEEYLITILTEIKISDEDIENLRELIKVLNFVNNCKVADELKVTLNTYIDLVNVGVKSLLSVAQLDFINLHPEIKDLFPSLNLQDKDLREKINGPKSFKTTSG